MLPAPSFERVERSGGNKAPAGAPDRCWPPTSWQRPSWPGAFLGAGFSRSICSSRLLGRGLFSRQAWLRHHQPSSPEPSLAGAFFAAGFSSAGAASASAFLAGAFFFAGAFLGAGCSLAGFLRLDRGLKLLDGHFRVRSTSALSNRKSTTLSSYSGARSWAAAIGSDWMYSTKRWRSSGRYCCAACWNQHPTFPARSLPRRWPGRFPTTAGPDAPGARQSPCTRPSRPRSASAPRRDHSSRAASCWELSPDLFELGFDHRLRDREIVTGGQLIEQRSLHLGAGQTGGLLLQLGCP